MKLEVRIKEAKKKTSRFFDYVKRVEGKIDQILCKRCRAIIRRVVDGKMKTLANYTEVKLFFDDGSAHITNLCITCARNIEKTELEDLYCADIEYNRLIPLVKHLTGQA